MAETLRIAGAARGPAVRFTFDGVALEGHAGESLAAALMALGMRRLRDGVDDTPRGAFCLMGLCQDCVVRVDGVPVEACRTTLRDGLVAERLR